MSSNPKRQLAGQIPKYLFVLSLCMLSLLYGVIAGYYGLFPLPQLREAKTAAEALVQVFSGEDDDAEKASEEALKAIPVIQNHAGIDDGALILVSGGPGFLKSYNPDGGCLAWLMDRKGKILHVWKYKSDLWSDLKTISTVPGESPIYPVDVHLLADGGLLVSFHGAHAWPYAIGMVRLDKDSNTVWKKECYAHHWFTITPDQKIITPTLRVVESPQKIGDTRGRVNGENGKILEDMVTVMSLEGDVLEEFSMWDVVNKSGLIGLYQAAEGTSADVDSVDPLHLNSILLVGERIAAGNDWLNADDLLVSLRNINTVAIVDRSTQRIKWRSSGTMLRQHSPLFLDSESILVFDNLGGVESLGGTRLAKIDLKSQETEAIFPTAEHPYSGKLYSSVFGHLDLNRDANAVLMAVTNQGMVLEIDVQSAKVLWEYHYTDSVDSNWDRKIQTAKYCYGVSFEMNQAEKAK